MYVYLIATLDLMTNFNFLSLFVSNNSLSLHIYLLIIYLLTKTRTRATSYDNISKGFSKFNTETVFVISGSRMLGDGL